MAVRNDKESWKIHKIGKAPKGGHNIDLQSTSTGKKESYTASFPVGGIPTPGDILTKKPKKFA